MIARHPIKMQNAEVRAVRTQASPQQHSGNAIGRGGIAVGSHRTPRDGGHFEHTQNKHCGSAFARRPNRAQRGHRKVTVAAQ